MEHELGHVAFSDFGAAEHLARKHPGCEGLLNVIEDALIERRAMERWPGVPRNLDMMFRQTLDTRATPRVAAVGRWFHRCRVSRADRHRRR